MAECFKIVDEQLSKNGVMRDVDVKELYLANSGLSQVIDMSRFSNLEYLWLNSNKIRELNCLKNNFRIGELYLQNNCLVDISGAIGHLTNLRVLFLQNNQLVRLEKVIKELIHIQSLQTLNLFDNPVAQESEYRPYIIHHIPSVTLLDRKEVLKQERDEGRRVYDQANTMVAERLAFGRRSEGPPELYYPGDAHTSSPTKAPEYEVGNNFYRDKGKDAVKVPSRCSQQLGHDPLSCKCAQPKLSPAFESEEQAVKTRQLRRAVMEYSSFDWSQVPRATQRRLAAQPFDKPQVITTRFR